MGKNKIQIVKDFFKVIVFLPFLLILRILNRFFSIRFKCLFVNRIGHQSMEFDLYCIEEQWEIFPKKKIDLFYYSSNPANNYLMTLMKRKKNCLRYSWFIRRLHFCNKFFPGYEKNNLDWSYFEDVLDSNFLTAQSSPLFCLKPREIDKGNFLLKKNFGCNLDKPIICFFNRDKAYLKLNPGFVQTDYSYHDYRDSSIKNYESALQGCAFHDRYTFFRMGKIVEEPLKNPHQQMIDYASSPHRSDFLDIYIMAKAKFIICAVSGLTEIGSLFRKKMAIVNMCPLLAGMRIVDGLPASFPGALLGNLIIFKKYYSKKMKRFLNLLEILDLNAQYFYEQKYYELNEIQLIENSPKEIKDLAEEMEMRLNNEWEETFEDKELQNRFWDLVGISNKNIHRDHFPKIGSVFLKTNPWLLQ